LRSHHRADAEVDVAAEEAADPDAIEAGAEVATTNQHRKNVGIAAVSSHIQKAIPAKQKIAFAIIVNARDILLGNAKRKRRLQTRKRAERFTLLVCKRNPAATRSSTLNSTTEKTFWAKDHVSRTPALKLVQRALVC